MPRKDRLSVLSVLQNGEPLRFLLTPEVLASEAVSKLPKKWQLQLRTWPQETLFDATTLRTKLAEEMPTFAWRETGGIPHRLLGLL